MSLQQKDGEATNDRPNTHDRKKGQCGNPKRQYKRASKGTVALIDAAFEWQVAIVENGESRRVSVFEAILLQLWIKEMSGDTRALAARLQYQEFVATQSGPPEIIIEHASQRLPETSNEK